MAAKISFSCGARWARCRRNAIGVEPLRRGEERLLDLVAARAARKPEPREMILVGDGLEPVAHHAIEDRIAGRRERLPGDRPASRRDHHVAGARRLRTGRPIAAADGVGAEDVVEGALEHARAPLPRLVRIAGEAGRRIAQRLLACEPCRRRPGRHGGASPLPGPAAARARARRVRPARGRPAMALRPGGNSRQGNLRIAAGARAGWRRNPESAPAPSRRSRRRPPNPSPAHRGSDRNPSSGRATTRFGATRLGAPGAGRGASMAAGIGSKTGATRSSTVAASGGPRLTGPGVEGSSGPGVDHGPAPPSGAGTRMPIR